MNPASFRRFVGLGFLLAVLCLRAGAQEKSSESVVALPPMVIEEDKNLPPWLYVQDSGTEYLSRCSERVTLAYVEMRRDRMDWVWSIVPREILFRTDVPIVTVLATQRIKSSSRTEVVDQIVQRTKDRSPNGSYLRATTAPNMMLNDADSLGIFAFIDESKFDAEGLTIASDYLRLFLDRRTPEIPLWLREGLISTYDAILYKEPGVTLRPLIWISLSESVRLQKNPLAPRALLPPGEIFSNPRRMPLRTAIGRSQCALFVRWALDPQNGVREAFRQFAIRASEEPVSEEMFQSIFGFGYSDLRDRLSDYLPTAVNNPLKIPLVRSTVPRLKAREATPSEVARIRGEWERLTVPFVRSRYASEADRYLNQAKQTLRRSYDAGDRHPALLATLGLCELESNNEKSARPLLEAATGANVIRPRAYAEVARLKWQDLVAANPTVQEYTYVEVSEINDLLHRGLAQAPALTEIFAQLADLWQRSAVPPTPGDLQRIKREQALFVSDPKICIALAAALARHGHTADAISLLGAGFIYARNDETRKQFAKVYASLEKPK